MRVWIRVAVAALSMLGLQPWTRAQPDIVIDALDDNGVLSWSNLNPSLYYRIEWTTSPDNTNSWRTDYTPLIDITSGAQTVTAPMPRLFRVVGGEEKLIPDATNVRAGKIVQGVSGTFWQGQRFEVLSSDTNVVIDYRTQLMWIRNLDTIPRTNWFAAQAAISNLAEGGYADWRFPTRIELSQLCNHPNSITIGLNDLLQTPHPFLNMTQVQLWVDEVCNQGPPYYDGRGVFPYQGGGGATTCEATLQHNFARTLPVRSIPPF